MRRICLILSFVFMGLSIGNLATAYSYTKSKSYTWLSYVTTPGDRSLVTHVDHSTIEGLPDRLRIQIGPGHFVAVGNVRNWLLTSVWLSVLAVISLLLGLVLKPKSVRSGAYKWKSPHR